MKAMKVSNFLIYILIFIFIFVIFTTPLSARVLPLNKITEMEELLFGETYQDEPSGRIVRLEETITGEQKTGNYQQRVDKLIEYVFPQEEGIPLMLVVNTLERYFTGEMKQGAILERIKSLEGYSSLQIEKEGLQNVITELFEQLDRASDFYKEVIISQGREITAIIQQDFSSDREENDLFINYTITEDIVVDDYVVIPANTIGRLQVIDLQSGSFFGRDGEIRVEAEPLMAVDGSKILIDVGQALKADSYSRELAVGASLLGTIVLNSPLGLIAGIFVRGREVSFVEGDQLILQIADEIAVKGFRKW